MKSKPGSIAAQQGHEAWDYTSFVEVWTLVETKIVPCLNHHMMSLEARPMNFVHNMLKVEIVYLLFNIKDQVY